VMRMSLGKTRKDTRKRKMTQKKSPDWAGATPLFRPRAAQKVFGVAPALFCASHDQISIALMVVLSGPRGTFRVACGPWPRMVAIELLLRSFDTDLFRNTEYMSRGSNVQ
jgi:hypothetical protein